MITHTLFCFIVTSDVQDVEVCSRFNFTLIRCIFLKNSTVNGCNYTLMGAVNVTGFIAKARRVEVVMSSVRSYTAIMVYGASDGNDVTNADRAITKALNNISDCQGWYLFYSQNSLFQVSLRYKWSRILAKSSNDYVDP